MEKQTVSHETPAYWQTGDFPDTGKYHFFFSSHCNWAVHEDFALGLAALRKATKSAMGKHGKESVAAIYFVPVPQAEKYRIENYAPVVEGRRLIGHFPMNLKGGSR